MPYPHHSIAIDGPAGAGKTTLAKELSKRLQGYVYVDTGALYRALAVHKLWLEKEVNEPVSDASALRTFDIEYNPGVDGAQTILLYGKDVTSYLRTPEISMLASTMSANPAVRTALLELQRRQVYANNVIMEGRDIGTVVLPDADVKIYLIADIETRVMRRLKDMQAAGENPEYCDVINQMRRRDWQDTTRDVAPLRPSCDSKMLDNTRLSFEKTVEKAIKIIRANIRDCVEVS